MHHPTGPPWTVLFTIPNFVTAGSGRALVNIATRLDRSTFTPMVAVAKKSGAALEVELEDHGIEVVELDLRVLPRPYATLLPRAWRRARALHALGVSVVHSFDYSDMYTEPMVARMAGTRYISTKKNMGWGSRAWTLRALFSERIAVQNDAMFRQFFSNRWHRQRVRYVPRGVVVERFARPDEAPSPTWRHHFGIPEEAVVIGCVANICQRKNQAQLIRAMPEDPNVHLLLAGAVLEAEYQTELDAAVSERGLAGRVHFTGSLEDVRPALWASDVFALTSRSEGSPVALLEAMSAGLPIVASAIPGIREFLYGVAGVDLVEVDDDAATSAALTRLVTDSDQRRERGKDTLDLVTARRSINLEVARTESMYLELLWTEAVDRA